MKILKIKKKKQLLEISNESQLDRIKQDKIQYNELLIAKNTLENDFFTLQTTVKGYEAQLSLIATEKK